jgi:hypothetical protein
MQYRSTVEFQVWNNAIYFLFNDGQLEVKLDSFLAPTLDRYGTDSFEPEGRIILRPHREPPATVLQRSPCLCPELERGRPAKKFTLYTKTTALIVTDCI